MATAQDTEKTPLEVVQAMYDEFAKEMRAGGDRGAWNLGYGAALRHVLENLKSLTE